MEIAFFNRCYWPDSEATGQLLTELCELLSVRFPVKVVVGQPNFIDSPSEFLIEGVQHRNGVAIHRLRHSQLPKGKRFGRVRNLVSFTLAVRKWLQRNRGEHRTAVEMAKRSGGAAPVWVCETDPFLLPLVVGPAARRVGARLVYYLQDIYPDVAVAVGVTKNNLAIRLLRQRLRRQYEQADAIVVLDEDMRDRLVGWGLPASKFHIVPNWMDCKSVVPIKRDNPFRLEHGLQDRFVVMHSGNMGMTQRLEHLVEAMHVSSLPDRCRLLLVGNGAKRSNLEEQVAAHGSVAGSPEGTEGAAKVLFFDYQPRERLAESLSAADLHLVSMDAAITGCLAPSKLYGILASGTPVLAIVPRGNAVWRFVEEHRIGWCVEPGDVSGIANAIREAAAMPQEDLLAMGARGRVLAETMFDKEVCCEQFLAVLKSVHG